MTCQCLHLRSFHQHSGVKGGKVGSCQVTGCPCLVYVKKAVQSDTTVPAPRYTCFRSGKSRGRPTEDQLWQEELAEEARLEVWRALIKKEKKFGALILEPTATVEEPPVKKPVEVVAKFFRKYGDTRVMAQKLRLAGKLKTGRFA